MAVKISELPVADALAGTEDVAVVQGGVTKRAVASLFGGGGGISTSVQFEGVSTPAALSAGPNDDWNPDLTEISRLNVSGPATAEITGLVPPATPDGRMIMLTNVGANTIILRDESVSSAAANRFGLNGDTLLPVNVTVVLMYVDAISRWSKWS